MKTLKTILGIAGLTGIVLLNACGEAHPGKLKGEYDLTESNKVIGITSLKSTNRIDAVSEEITTLSGRITKTHAGSVSFVYNTSDGDSTGTSGNHSFEWVLVDGATNRQLTLIYPYTKIIQEKFATIKYRALKDGKITTEEFVKLFISGDYTIYDNFVMEADGVIIGTRKMEKETLRGIEYK